MSSEPLNNPVFIIVSGSIIASAFFLLGLLIYRYKCYGLIIGYKHAPEHIKQQYDIEGLAKHVGQGLMTLAVLLIIGTVLLYFGLYGWFIAIMCVFILIAVIIPLGTSKFMPEQQQLITACSADAKHPILRRILPAGVYRSLEQSTRRWVQVCSKCGHKQDFWEAGGVRKGGIGEPRALQYCENCAKLHMHKIRKKTAQELIEELAINN